MSYHKVGYEANGVDFTDYFPAYEIYTQTINVLYIDSNYTIPLSKNIKSTTNYVSFVQPYFVSGTGATVYQLSSSISTPSINDKTSTSYKVWLNSSISVASNINLVLWCITFYIQETPKTYIDQFSEISNLNYKVNNVAYNPVLYFPQFMIHQNTLTATGNQSLQNSLASKNTSSLLTSYLKFGSITNNSVSTINSGDVQKIMYYENPKVYNNYDILFSISTRTLSITLNTITLFLPPTNPVNNFISNYNVGSDGLEKIFPVCERFIKAINGAAADREFNHILNKNTRLTDNYIVLTSMTYTDSGSSGTFNPWEASSLTGIPIVANKTATSFDVFLKTPSGDNWSGGLVSLVIYI